MSNYWETDLIELQIPDGYEPDEDSDFRLHFDIWNKDDEKVGFVHVDKMDARIGRCSIFVSIEEAYQNKGYGTDAARLVIDYLFSYKRYHRIECTITQQLGSSKEAFLAKLGFQREGVWKGYRYGCDAYVYSLLAIDYDKENDNDSTNNASVEVMGKLELQLPPATNACANTTLTLRSMTRNAYAYKHEIMYDRESSLMLDGTVNLPVDPELLSPWEEKHLVDEAYGDCVEYAIVNEDGDMVGVGGVDGMDGKDLKFSYHLYIFEEYAGMGYGSQALYLLLRVGFIEKSMRSMYTYIDTSNMASLRVAARNGCVIEGLARDMEYYDGHYADNYMVGMTREAFLALHKIDNVWNI